MSYTPTTNFGLKKPNYGDPADIKDLNDDMDDIDTIMHQNRLMLAEPFDQTKDYSEGKMVVYEGASYRFKTDHSAGNWDASEVDPMPIADGASGGGSAEVTKTVEGNPITFSDGADAPLVECVATVEASQDLHGYDKPWVGGAGKNKLDDSGVLRGYYNTSGTLVASNKSLSYTVDLPAGTYTFSTDLELCTITRYLIDDVNTNVGETTQSYTVTLPTDANFKITMSRSDAADISGTPKSQIESGSQATSYEPYSNICPISGMSEVKINGCGKNLLPNNWTQGLLSLSDGTTTSSNNYWVYTDFFIDIHWNIYMTFSANLNNRGVLYFYDKNKQFITTKQVVAGNSSLSIGRAANYYYCKVGFNISGSSTAITPSSMASYNCQLEKGTTATTYEPYAGHTYTISLGGTYYSGQIDVVKGVLVATSQMEVFDNTVTVTIGRANYDNWYYNIASTQSLSGSIIPLSNQYEGAEILNDNYNLGIYKLGSGYIRVRTGGTKPADTSAFVADLGTTPLQVLYDLPTPIEIPLTPIAIRSLLGDNYISTDAKKLNLTYITQDYEPLVELAEAGGGGSSYAETVLYNNDSPTYFTPAAPLNAELSDDYTNYNMLVMEVAENSFPTYRSQIMLLTSMINTSSSIYNGAITTIYNQWSLPAFTVIDSTHFQFKGADSSTPMLLYKIVGIKF